jgi:hypothetical protein
MIDVYTSKPVVLALVPSAGASGALAVAVNGAGSAVRPNLRILDR